MWHNCMVKFRWGPAIPVWIGLLRVHWRGEPDGQWGAGACAAGVLSGASRAAGVLRRQPCGGAYPQRRHLFLGLRRVWLGGHLLYNFFCVLNDCLFVCLFVWLSVSLFWKLNFMWLHCCFSLYRAARPGLWRWLCLPNASEWNPILLVDKQWLYDFIHSNWLSPYAPPIPKLWILNDWTGMNQTIKQQVFED